MTAWAAPAAREVDGSLLLPTETRRRHLVPNPGVPAHLIDAMADACRDARIDGERETHLPRPIFTADRPLTFDVAIGRCSHERGF